MTGFLQAATLDAPGDVLAGGTLTVNGQRVVVPRNTLVVFPAAYLTWQQVFELAPPPYGPTQTGLAMSDTPAPFVPYEVHVIGNRVASGQPGTNDRYIAGLVFIAQQSLNSGQGYINFIDYTTGEFLVGGVIGDPTTGQRVRINDPLGRFGRASSPDPRFTIDEENPNIRSETGYPFCMPRTDPAVADDPLCPQKNRPIDGATGTFATVFTMPPLPAGADCTAAMAGPDPCLMAPLEVGDFVTYSGTLVKDGAQPSAGPNPTITPLNQSYISAWMVTANVGLFTAPRTSPVYVATDVALLGTGGVTAAGAAEATIRTRFEGFTTDATHFASVDPACNDPIFAKALGDCSVVDLYGIDFDPCTGAVAERPWGAIDVDRGPPSGAVKGRWRFRPPNRSIPLAGASGIFDPPPQQMRAKLRGATQMVTKNGLISGQYTAPIGEYLFPENAGTGTPIVPNNFEVFGFLAQGLGPLDGAGGSGPIVGQLSPWPGAVAPTKVCSAPAPTQPPVATAAILSTPPFVTGVPITLVGTGTNGGGSPLTFAWTAPAGITLNSTTVDKPSFVAASGGTYTFTLVVSNAAGASAPASVSVTVAQASTTTLPPVANAGANQTVAAGAIVHLNGTASSDPNVPAQALSYAWTAPAGITLTGATTASPTFTAPVGSTSTTLTFSLVVTNTPGGLSSAPSSVSIAVNPATAPVAIVGPAQTVLHGAAVTLDGTASFDPNGLPLTYAWQQLGGPTVTLSSTASATPTFTAPNVVNPTALTFGLVVSDSLGLSSPSTLPLPTSAVVQVIVLAATDQVIIATAEYRIGKQRLTVTATSDVPAAQLFLVDPSLATPPTTCSSTTIGCIPLTLQAGIPTVILVGVAQPSTVTVLSNLGGSATSGITRLR